MAKDEDLDIVVPGIGGASHEGDQAAEEQIDEGEEHGSSLLWKGPILQRRCSLTRSAFLCPSGQIDLDAVVLTPRGEQVGIRDILIHMIEEYARHCGHADLLGERVDGRTGQ
jgi:Protein of unknown function (DUF664)